MAKSVKRFERSNGLDTALYKNYLFFSLVVLNVINVLSPTFLIIFLVLSLVVLNVILVLSLVALINCPCSPFVILVRPICHFNMPVLFASIYTRNCFISGEAESTQVYRRPEQVVGESCDGVNQSLVM